MNLNKTLCKYIDIEKKGYVNIGDVIYFTLFWGVITAALCGLIYSFYQGYLIITTDRIFSVPQGTNDWMGSFGIAIVIIFLAILIIAGIAYACTIKIAKCEYKKDDK